MNSGTLSATFGVILSLAFSYVPGVKGWYDRQDATRKRLIMAAGLVVIAGAAYGLSCANNPYLAFVTCDQDGIAGLVSALIGALVGNQATYLISPKRGS